MPDTPDLDTRIRELVARAVADAPPAPELEPVFELRRNHRPWWIGGGIAVTAAAAAIAVFTFGGQEDKVATVRATDPTVATVPKTAPAPSTPGTQAPDTAPPASSGPPVTAPPTPGTGGGAVVTAGPDGVARWVDGAPTTISTEPMAFAIDLGDGRILAQRFAGPITAPYGRTDADTAPVVIARDGTITELFGTVDWDGAVRMHDLEIVDGRPLLLFSLAVGMENPDTADETLYVVDLDTAERTEIAQVGGWEFGTGRLHLAATGLIVGEWGSGPSHGVEIHAVPGSPAAGDEPTAADLGLPPDGYDDCSNCPESFAVSSDGTAVAWIDPADEFSSYELVVHPLGGGDERRAALHPDVPANLVEDIDPGADESLISFFDGGTGQVPSPVAIPGATPSDAPTVLSGEVATVGPTAAITVVAPSSTRPPADPVATLSSPSPSSSATLSS